MYKNIICVDALRPLLREEYKFGSKLSKPSEKRENNILYRNYGINKIKADQFSDRTAFPNPEA